MIALLIIATWLALSWLVFRGLVRAANRAWDGPLDVLEVVVYTASALLTPCGAAILLGMRISEWSEGATIPSQKVDRIARKIAGIK